MIPEGIIPRLREAMERLMASGNVIGYAVSKYKYVRGQRVEPGRPVVMVFVARKLPPHAVPREELVPPRVTVGSTEVLTDVVEIARPTALPGPPAAVAAQAGRHRPVPSGVSGAAATSSACSIGPFFRGPGGETYIVTCAHCSARIDVSCEVGGAPGNPFLQPSPFDGGTRGRDEIGVVAWASNIAVPQIELDAALVRVHEGVGVTPVIFGANIPIVGMRDVTPGDVGLKVVKSGRSTGVTYGEIVALGGTVKVSYGACGTAVAVNAIVTTGMIERGDSGAALVTHGGELLGVLFAVSDKFSFAEPVAPLARAHGLELLAYRREPVSFSVAV